MLTLQRPIAFIDLETTGTNRETDRIVSLSIQKVIDLSVYPVRSELLTMLINPGMPIPAKATGIHGITDADVASCQPFEAVAVDVLNFISGCDLAGFGSNYYDIPLLFHEFSRALIYWETKDVHLVDAGNLFKIQEPRGLSAALKFYCNREHEAAHTSEGDVAATIDVFLAQLQRYPELQNKTVAELAHLSNYSRKRADLSGKFYYDEQDTLYFNFGPHKDLPAAEQPDFLEWILMRDFARDTKQIARLALDQIYTASDDTDADGFPF